MGRPAVGKEWRFDTTHQRVVSITDLATGRAVLITRNASGVPSRIADSWGNWAWNLTLSGSNVTRIDVEGRPDLYWTYSYHGFTEMPQVVAGPNGATWRTYQYGAGYYYENMTAVRDGNGRLLEGHNSVTNAEGPATSSSRPNEEITMIRYGLAGRVPGETVTEFDFLDGRTVKHYVRPIAGQRQTVQIEDPLPS